MIKIPADSDFGLNNLPWGIFSAYGGSPRVGVAVGDHVLDMAAVADRQPFGHDVDVSVFYESTLNPLISLGPSHCTRVRAQIQTWLSQGSSPLHEDDLYVPMTEVTMHLPVDVGDYTDFYSSREHATNVGSLFRDPDKALLPNWRHLPVAYHGRASSIVVSGTPVRRPRGQVKKNDMDAPDFRPSERLDLELEMALIMHDGPTLGQPIPVDEAENYIFGLALFNDWSARDIQKWEYQPLGPFLGKNFASTLAPWIVPLAALEPFRTAAPEQDPAVLPHLRETRRSTFAIDLAVDLTPAGGEPTTICRTNYAGLYWTPAQQIAHHASNGCNLRAGDVLASGTISGAAPDAAGSLLELSAGGRQQISLANGASRTFLEDGDTVTLRATCGTGPHRIGFGTASGTILPAHDL